MNLVTPTAQHSGQRMIRVLVVLDQEEANRTARWCCARHLGGFRDGVSFACRKERGEFGASIASITFGVDGAAMRFNQRFADGETESKPAEFSAPRLFESVKYFRQQVGINPATRRFDCHSKVSAAVVCRANANFSAVGSKLDRVLDQIPEYLLQPRRVGPEENLLGSKLGPQLELFSLDSGLAYLEYISQQLVSV